ncbi:MAG TPA: dethiobiotin synthase [Thermodesulfovibrionales bacterium]|nr:dethiobiotin synthase [Thermodesulfovibrionales bacterium]
MPKGFFITGTDTGVGKTIITGALIKVISRMGFSVGGMKPIESGCLLEGNILVPSDGMFIKATAHMEEDIGLITPCCFRTPLAPLPASEIEGLPVDIKKIRRAFDDLSRKYDTLVVEGMGGLLVPITKNYFIIDMAKDFKLPTIVVARPSLGTINHTLLTVNYAIREGLQIAGIVINYSLPPEDTIAENTNPDILKQISPVPVIGIFPYLVDTGRAAVEKAAAEHLDTEIIGSLLRRQRGPSNGY